MTRSQLFIDKYKYRLSSGKFFFNPDTSYMDVSGFSCAKCRMLLVFSSPAEFKVLSGTFSALNDYIITHCGSDVFLDVAYVPSEGDIALYDKERVSYAIGQITHLDASHFDFIGFSVSVLYEIPTVMSVIKSFERCDVSIPSFWSQRSVKEFGSVPFIFLGGIASSLSEALYGKVKVGSSIEEALSDFTYLGSCEKLGIIFRRFIEARDNGLVRRSSEDCLVSGREVAEYMQFTEECKIATNQDFIECLFDLDNIYHPQGYKVIYNDNNRVIANIKVNVKCRDFVVPYYSHTLSSGLGISRMVISANGSGVGRSEVQLSEGCSAGGACSFCLEGNYTGGWVEQDSEVILRNALESKKYSAGYSIKPFSFNTNYVSDYKGILLDLLKIYPEATFLNMRLEELGRDEDALRMMLYGGSRKLQAPMEGTSPRLQNNLLNKCLSKESLDKFMEVALEQRIMELKCGLILTCYECSEDWDWLFSYLEGLSFRAEERGKKLPIRLVFTPLVHYPFTPLEYLERKSARLSYEGLNPFPSDLDERIKGLDFRYSCNGFRYSTFLEQSLLDLGRLLTSLLWEHFGKDCKVIYTLRHLVKQSSGYIVALRGIVRSGMFDDRQLESYISPYHRIRTVLEGTWLDRVRRLLSAKANGDIFAVNEDIRCLRTYEGAKVRCYHNCIKIAPIKRFKDVYLKDNALVGSYTLSEGCTRCTSNYERNLMLNKSVTSSVTFDDVRSLDRLQKVQKLRFIVQRLSGFSLLNPHNTAHTFITKFLQRSERLLSLYHSIDNHSMIGQCKSSDLLYNLSGIQVVDVYFGGDVYDEVTSLVEVINAELKSVRVNSVRIVDLDDKIKRTDIVLYSFSSDFPFDMWHQGRMSYAGSIKVINDLGCVVNKVDTKLRAPYFKKGKSSGIVGNFLLPVAYTPLMYYLGFFSSVKRLQSAQVVEGISTSSMLLIRPIKGKCNQCGSEGNFRSLLSGSVISMCSDCLSKSMLSKLG